MKKTGFFFFASIWLVLLLLCGNSYSTASTGDFADVTIDNWTYPYVEAIYRAGITIGCGSANGNRYYCPAADVTRGQMAAFIIRALYGEQTTYNQTPTPYFTDVPATHPFFKYVQKLKDVGITTVPQGGAYSVDSPVTRSQMAAFIVRARQVKNNLSPADNAISVNNTTTAYFTDVPVGSTYFLYVQKLHEDNLTTKSVNGPYDASGNATRDQMAAFISRAFLATSATDNVLPVTVNGSLCDPKNSYPNKPCVSVTICAPNTTTCQTIKDILLDSGSFGLRIFKQASQGVPLITVPLTQVTIGSGALAECVQYGDGSSNWGPVMMADVILGNEPAVPVPVQVIDYTFGTPPSACRYADQYPSDGLYTGILGVGPLVHDCGALCAPPNTGIGGNYYVCSGTAGGTVCTPTAAPLSSQVQNPVAQLPYDNNGVLIQLPAVPFGGIPSVDGNLILGIGTQLNNIPSQAIAYPADPMTGNFATNFDGSSYSSSFIDSGSNGLFFSSPAAGIPDCRDQTGASTGWFCPSARRSFNAANIGYQGSPGGTVSFYIDNFDALTASPNNKVFVEIGGDNVADYGGGIGAGQFDWGLPFHFGRNVYFGIEGAASLLGSGPYFAY